jgi:thiol:disulfide interchange protein
MAIEVEHELHRRRRSRNLGLGLVLVAFVALVFGLTVVKVSMLGDGAIPHLGDGQ